MSIKFFSVEFFYVNRLFSLSSDSIVFSSYDLGYENIWKFIRSDLFYSVLGNGNDDVFVVIYVLKFDEVSLVGKLVVCSEIKYCEFNIEFSGILNSFWGSSIWDSCSIFDFYENSSEFMFTEKVVRRFNVVNNKFFFEVFIFYIV